MTSRLETNCWSLWTFLLDCVFDVDTGRWDLVMEIKKGGEKQGNRGYTEPGSAWGLVGTIWSGSSIQPKKEAKKDKNKHCISVRNPGNCTERIKTPATFQGECFHYSGISNIDVLIPAQPSLSSKSICQVQPITARLHNSADCYLCCVIAFGLNRWTDLTDTVDTIQLFQTTRNVMI